MRNENRRKISGERSLLASIFDMIDDYLIALRCRLQHNLVIISPLINYNVLWLVFIKTQVSLEGKITISLMK